MSATQAPAAPQAKPEMKQEVRQEAVEKPKPDFVMPAIGPGEPCVWFIEGTGKRCAAVCSSRTERHVNLFVYVNDHTPIPQMKQAVRHVSDPARSGYDVSQAGFWDYTDQQKELQAQLERRLK